MNIAHIVAVAAASVLAAAPAFASDLFGPSIAPKRAIESRPEEVLVRVATPDLTLLPSLAKRATDAQGMPTFTLDLFDDVRITAEVTRTETTAGGGLAIIATLPEHKYGSAVLVQNGSVLTGSVTFIGGSYSILPTESGAVRIAKINPQLLPPEGEPRVGKGAVPTLAESLAPADPPVDTGKLIDLIVFWTPAAQAAAGSLANIQNNIDQAITLTNTAYRNSGIAQRVRLVNKQAVTYTENTSGSGAFDNALSALTAGSIPTAGGSTVGAQRNAYGADDMVIVINDSQYCGLAWLPSTISTGNANSYAGAVVGGGSCLTTNFSFGHELGHNMGAHHDPYVAPGPGAFAYSHGLSHIGGSSATSWRTIMAYNNQCAATVGGCTRLQYFSNPMVNYTDGFAMGDGPARNNALTLNKSANAVSNYRATVVPITASFADVPLGDTNFGYIEFMYQAGFSNGCSASPLLYCPQNAVTRGEMAAFMERSKRGANFTKTATGTVFADVSAGAPFAGYIEQMYADGITNGCATGPLRYCPNDNVTRAQMAKFLLIAKCGGSYVPATPGASPFSDVPVGDLFLPWINKLYTLGITTGCATSPTLQYCPNVNVSRAQMAIFIYRTFPHVAPSEACTP